ncbi:MAG: NUDIX domain-containing protein [Halieaceae bacterium]
MTDDRFTPHATVATVVEHDGKFLLVEEFSQGRRVLNQPAGHLEPNESLIEAAIREALEETCWEVALTGYLGVTIVNAANGVCYLRHSFAAQPLRFCDSATRDSSILDTHWLTRDEIASASTDLRHAVVLDIVDQYLENGAVPLNFVRYL